MTALAWRSMQGPAQSQTGSGTLMACNKEPMTLKGCQAPWGHNVKPQRRVQILLPLESRKLQQGWHLT